MSVLCCVSERVFEDFHFVKMIYHIANICMVFHLISTRVLFVWVGRREKENKSSLLILTLQSWIINNNAKYLEG